MTDDPLAYLRQIAADRAEATAGRECVTTSTLQWAVDEIARLRLTDAEREAVEWAESAARDCEHPADAPLRGLLERLGGGE